MCRVDVLEREPQRRILRGNGIRARRAWHDEPLRCRARPVLQAECCVADRATLLNERDEIQNIAAWSAAARLYTSPVVSISMLTCPTIRSRSSTRWDYAAHRRMRRVHRRFHIMAIFRQGTSLGTHRTDPMSRGHTVVRQAGHLIRIWRTSVGGLVITRGPIAFEAACSVPGIAVRSNTSRISTLPMPPVTPSAPAAYSSEDNKTMRWVDRLPVIVVAMSAPLFFSKVLKSPPASLTGLPFVAMDRNRWIATRARLTTFDHSRARSRLRVHR
jgi:hypothetical protein